MNLIPAINQMESDKKRFKNIKDEKYRDLRSAYWTFSKYCNICDCNVGHNPDFILESLFEDKRVSCSCFKDLGYLPIKGEIDVTPAMIIILGEIKENEKKYQKQIKEIDGGLKVVREMNTTCERCQGLGEVQKPRPNVYCEREYITCPECHGTGEKKKG